MRVALLHRSVYEFDRPVALAPHEVRLRPMPGAVNIGHYLLSILPAAHTCYWYQDAPGNSVARVVFPNPAVRLEFNVHLEADLPILNPFSFLLENYAHRFPFRYDESLRHDLSPYLASPSFQVDGPLTQAMIEAIHAKSGQESVAMLVDLNRAIHERIAYRIREEPGVQSPEESLRLGKGSCRDSAWLLIHIARALGLAARFVSGYQIQPRAESRRNAQLHAWAEVYLPGAGWVGFDPTLGLLKSEHYIPLAASATVEGAAPVRGSHDLCAVRTHFQIDIEHLPD